MVRPRNGKLPLKFVLHFFVSTHKLNFFDRTKAAAQYIAFVFDVHFLICGDPHYSRYCEENIKTKLLFVRMQLYLLVDEKSIFPFAKTLSVKSSGDRRATIPHRFDGRCNGNCTRTDANASKRTSSSSRLPSEVTDFVHSFFHRFVMCLPTTA